MPKIRRKFEPEFREGAVIKMAIAVRGGAQELRDVISNRPRIDLHGDQLHDVVCGSAHPPEHGPSRVMLIDNAAAESFFSSLDWEVLSRHHFRTKDQARGLISAGSTSSTTPGGKAVPT